MKYFEIALAGAFGALIGLFVGLYMEWNLWLCVPLCGTAAFMFYKPLEVTEVIAAVSKEFSSLIRQGCVTAVQKRRDVGLGFANNVSRMIYGIWLMILWIKVHFWKIAYVVSLIVAMVAIFGMLPFALYPLGILPLKEEGSELIELVGLSVLIAFAGFIVVGLTALANKPGEFSPTFLPIFRRIGNMLTATEELASDPSAWSFKLWLWVGIFLPLLLDLCALLTPVLLFDSVLSILITCSTSKRIAAMLGGTFGGCAGAACWSVGVPQGEFILLAGLVVGFATGPYLYILRERMVAIPTN